MNEQNENQKCDIENDVNECALKTIMCYSQISNNFSNCSNEIYNSTDCMHSTCDYFAYSIKYLFSTLTCQRIEPFNSQWFRMGFMKYENDKFTYHCKYHYLKNEHDFTCEFITNSDLYIYITSKFKNYIIELSKSKYFYKKKYYIKPWFTMKYTIEQDTYIISRLNNDCKIDIYEKSNIHFLSIEYTHPDMEERRVPLELDRDIYVSGNEILSVGMIKHLLEHQLESYVFDLKYSVFLMDNNIDMYELKCDEYILLDKDKIFIMNNL